MNVKLFVTIQAAINAANTIKYRQLGTDLSWVYHAIYNRNDIEFSYPDWVLVWKETYESLTGVIREIKRQRYNDSNKIASYELWLATKDSLLNYMGQMATDLLEQRSEMKAWNAKKGYHNDKLSK